MSAPNTQPRTRDLDELVDALAISEDELRFQVDRLKDTKDEFLARLRDQYAAAIGALVTLRRYQQGRLDARRMVNAPAPVVRVENQPTNFDNAIDAAGRAIAHHDEDEA